MVIEPLVQGAAGMITAPEGYLRRVREVTRECDVLLIADEVAVGFGRTGTLFACEQEGVVARLPLPGQGADRRLPAAGGDADDRARSSPPSWAGPRRAGRSTTATPTPATRSGAAVALASLELLRDAGVLAALPAKVERLREHLERLAELPHRRRRPPARADGRHRAGAGPGDEGAVPAGAAHGRRGSAGAAATRACCCGRWAT